MSLFNSVEDLFKSAYELLASVFGTIANVIQTFITTVLAFFTGLINMVSDVFSGVVGVVGGITNFVFGGFPTLRDTEQCVYWKVLTFLPGNIVILGVIGAGLFLYTRTRQQQGKPVTGGDKKKVN